MPRRRIRTGKRDPHAITSHFAGRLTATGLVAGVVLGWLLSLPSGGYFVTLGVATLGLFVGAILGIVHRNDA
jgi:hypothetical protein